MQTEQEAQSLKTALDYNKEKYDTMGWDAREHYKPIEWWEIQEYDEMPDVLDISKLIVDILTALDEQKIILLVQGEQGAGKSIFAFALLWMVAIRMAWHRWKDMSRWREVYDYVKNTAIMLKDDTDTMVKNMKKGQSYLLDDVYDALAAEEWYTQIHKAINSIMIADRTDRTFTIITVPRGTWIDRIVRGIARYRGDVKRNVGLKQLGYNELKFVILKWNEWDPNKSTPNTPYIKTRDTTWEDAYYALAPKEIRDWYRPMRRIKLEALKEEKRKPQEEKVVEKARVSQIFYDWLKLSKNSDLLEKRPNGKFFSGYYIAQEFQRQNKGWEIGESTARAIIRKARVEAMH